MNYRDPYNRPFDNQPFSNTAASNSSGSPMVAALVVLASLLTVLGLVSAAFK